MTSTVSKLRNLFGLCLVATTLGCGGEAKPSHLPALVPYSIKVTHNGTAVEGAKVLMAPKSGSFSAAGVTNADGVAQMKAEGQYAGAPVGDYVVSVSKVEENVQDLGPVPTDPKEFAEYNKKVKSAPKPKAMLPTKYASFGSSGLTATVQSGKNEPHTIDLKGE